VEASHFLHLGEVLRRLRDPPAFRFQQQPGFLVRLQQARQGIHASSSGAEMIGAGGYQGSPRGWGREGGPHQEQCVGTALAGLAAPWCRLPLGAASLVAGASASKLWSQQFVSIDVLEEVEHPLIFWSVRCASMPGEHLNEQGANPQHNVGSERIGDPPPALEDDSPLARALVLAVEFLDGRLGHRGTQCHPAGWFFAVFFVGSRQDEGLADDKRVVATSSRFMNVLLQMSAVRNAPSGEQAFPQGRDLYPR